MNQSNIPYQCELTSVLLGKEPLQLGGIPEVYYFCDDNLYNYAIRLCINFEPDCKCNKFGKIP